MILSHTILVNGLLYTWKSHRLQEKFPIPKMASSDIGSFSPQYFPSIFCQEPVVIHVALFENYEGWRGWMSSLQQHPSKPETLPSPTGFEYCGPLKYAEFEATVQGDHAFQFWWVKDNIQNKEWSSSYE